MSEKPKKPKTPSKNTVTPPPLDIGLPKSGLLKNKKVMDIVPQSRTLPSTSAKPVIVSNRAVVKDPMAPPELTDAPIEPMQNVRKESKKVVIQPLHDNVAPEESSEDSVAPKEEQSFLTPDESEASNPLLEDESQEVAPGTQTVPENTHDTKTKEQAPEKEDAPEADDADVADTADDIKKSTEPKPEDIEREKAEKRADEAAELIASRKYFLPINSVKKRRSMQLLFVLLVLILVAVVGGLYLLDAGIVTTVTAPTDFISN